MNNGCICCTVRGDLIRILGTLMTKSDKFDYILIETTGLADPAPIAQTFFTVPELSAKMRLDGIITLVDAKHILQHLLEVKPNGVENEAVEQVAFFADRILLNKIDLVTEQELQNVETKIKAINSGVEIYRTKNAEIALDKILQIRAFDLDKILKAEPLFLMDQDHSHDSSVYSVSFQFGGEFDLDKLNTWMSATLKEKGTDIYRMKGVLAIHGMETKFVFQGVHMLFDGRPHEETWGKDEVRTNHIVFIGKNLDKKELGNGLKACIYCAI